MPVAHPLPSHATLCLRYASYPVPQVGTARRQRAKAPGVHISTQPDVRKREAGAQQVWSRLEPPAALAHGVQVLLEAVEGLSELARPLLLAWLGAGGWGWGLERRSR